MTALNGNRNMGTDMRLTDPLPCERNNVVAEARHSGTGRRHRDSQTARLVRNALQWSPFLEDVTFDVAAANGTVTLTGISPYRSLSRIALMIAYTIPGVRTVIDDIRIVEPR